MVWLSWGKNLVHEATHVCLKGIQVGADTWITGSKAPKGIMTSECGLEDYWLF